MYTLGLYIHMNNIHQHMNKYTPNSYILHTPWTHTHTIMLTCTHVQSHAQTHTLSTRVHANILNTSAQIHTMYTYYEHTLYTCTHNIMNTKIRYGYLQTARMGTSIPFKSILERRIVERSSLGKELLRISHVFSRERIIMYYSTTCLPAKSCSKISWRMTS